MDLTVLRNKGHLVSVLTGIFVSALSLSCQHHYYPPHSEISKNLKNEGVASIQQENNRFLLSEEKMRIRLMDLVTHRWFQSDQEDDYPIGAKDLLTIKFLPDESLSKTVKVPETGNIGFDLIGDISVIGDTTPTIEDKLKRRFSKFYRKPEVIVSVKEHNSKIVTLAGAFKAPGVRPIERNQVKLSEVVSLAGGMSDTSANFLVLVPRERLRNRASLTGIDGIEIPLLETFANLPFSILDIPVRAGDVVYIPEAGTVSVMGEVAGGGNFKIQPGMTLLGALAAAGGVKADAEFSEVELFRTTSNVRYFLDLEKFLLGKERDIAVRDGDVIIVPTNRSRRISNSTVQAIVELTKLGVGIAYE